MGRGGIRMLERTLYFLLILTPICLAEPIKGVESTVTLIGHRYYFSIDANGYYTACHYGIAVGNVTRRFTQSEAGYFQNTTHGYGWMVINMTTENGEILHIELGKRDNPFVWELVSGSWFAFHRTEMSGPVYVEGRYIGMYRTTALAFGKTFIMEDFPVA